MKKFVIGVDFGAAFIKAGVCDDSGNLLSSTRRPTPAAKGVSSVVAEISKAIRDTTIKSGVRKSNIGGIVLVACGLIDSKKGVFLSSSVMSDWKDVPLANLISQSVHYPTKVANDANAAIFGEWWAGKARGSKVLVGMTLGTGIGGGIIIDGNIFYGHKGLAGEFGHMTIDPFGPRCFCGNYGCLGTIAGGNGMVQRYSRMSGDENIKSPFDIYLLASQGNDVAREVIKDTGKYLGIGVLNLLNVFNPDTVVFTGGITKMGNMLIDLISFEI